MKNKSELIFALIAIIMGVLTRTIFDLGINIEMVTAFAIVSGFFFKNKQVAYLVPFAIMVISDTFIGNTSIFIFTWSAFLVGPFIGSLLRSFLNKLKSQNFGVKLLGSQSAGVISTLIFFFWTNFGVWLIGDMYAKNINGLVQSYINAIPFLNNQLSSNLIIVPLVFSFGLIYFELKPSNNLIVKKMVE